MILFPGTFKRKLDEFETVVVDDYEEGPKCKETQLGSEMKLRTLKNVLNLEDYQINVMEEFVKLTGLR